MSDTNKKQYTVEFTEGEAEQIEEKASTQGISTPDFVIYCTRAISFGINYAIKMLPNQGQNGTEQ